MSIEFRREDAELAERQEVGAGVVDDEGALSRAPDHLEHLRLGREQVDVVEQALKKRNEDEKLIFWKCSEVGSNPGIMSGRLDRQFEKIKVKTNWFSNQNSHKKENFSFPVELFKIKADKK